MEGRGLAKIALAKLADVHYTNLGKYERGEASPSATILNRIAQALELSPDFLINGTLEEKGGASITDERLLQQFRKIEQLLEKKPSF